MLKQLDPKWKVAILVTLSILFVFVLLPLYIWTTALLVFQQQHFSYPQALLLTLSVVCVIFVQYDTRGK